MTLALFSLVNYADVLVFFDFMCVPQEGFTEDGTVIPRTEGEVKVFQECLASMSVLYSMFPVLVCDEVPESTTSYFDSGWCFAELVTASLGGQLSLLSPAASSDASVTTWQPRLHAEEFDLDELLEALMIELSKKTVSRRN